MTCELLTTAEAAEMLGLSKVTLDIWRSQRKQGQPPFVRLGSKLIRYRREDIQAWINSRVESPK